MAKSQLPDGLSVELDALALLPVAPRGSVTALAKRYGCSVRVLYVTLFRRRYGRFGRSPTGSNRAPLTFLTVEQRADYFTYRRQGYRRAEALNAIWEASK